MLQSRTNHSKRLARNVMDDRLHSLESPTHGSRHPDSALSEGDGKCVNKPTYETPCPLQGTPSMSFSLNTTRRASGPLIEFFASREDSEDAVQSAYCAAFRA